jgi:glycogen debranching enzyme
MPFINRWPAFFRNFSETGYNMVHFAPVNTRGISNSPYAIYNQLSISDDLFEEKYSEEEKDLQLAAMIKSIRNSFSILSVFLLDNRLQILYGTILLATAHGSLITLKQVC